MSRARELDQFYTSRSVASDCFEFLSKTICLTASDTFLEPSAGDGAFFDLMPAGRRVGVDLDPKHPEVLRLDFLEGFTPHQVAGRWIAVGNPAFGKNSSLAVQFFNKAAQFSEVVAFVLPLTFRKQSLQKRLDPNFILAAELALPTESFVFEGQPYSVPCCFQVWKRSTELRTWVDLPLSHEDFEFCDAEEADFAIRRVGAHAGKILRQFAGYSRGSNYFIRSNINVEDLVGRLATIDWSDTKGNTAGNPSIGKRELVAKYAEQCATGKGAKVAAQPSDEEFVAGKHDPRVPRLIRNCTLRNFTGAGRDAFCHRPP